MKKRSHRFAKSLLALLLIGTLGALLWLGVVPPRYLPFAPIDLADPSGPFIDIRLAALVRDRETCARLAAAPQITGRTIPDQPFEKGCGWTNALRLSEAGGTRVPAAQLTCPMAAALALWLEHEVQPIAEALFGKKVASIVQMGTYSCRNIIGSKTLSNMRSEHAKANAIDIGGFVLADGRRITLLRHWSDTGPDGDFLRRVKSRSCRYFRVSLGPEFNAAHRDHFHFDRGPFWACR